MSKKKRQGPLTGMYRVADLSQAVSLSPRAIRSYVERKLLPPPSGRGTGLIYGEVHMHKLLAMRKIRQESGGLLEDIAADLDKLSPAQLAALAATAPRGDAPAGGAAAVGIPAVGAGAASFAQPSELWQRVVIVPGLEIHLRTDSGPLARRLADEMLAHYGTGRSAS